jgi:hypothetical protein
VVRHQAEGEQPDLELASGLEQERDKRFVVSRLSKDGHTSISTVHDVLDNASGRDAPRSWHRT